ncbi:uncharacterized protein LOC107636281 [Arachis ipaensis]|uniref:uncharacterized protein LOC107636281 n=1 Tax=Arachis ipaensis TaxID=130454 RepID=UPI0007AF7DDE|nr:uncharacterized protein LOC107636281 [Arachis ipaensis]
MLLDLKISILQKLGVCETKWVKKLLYKILIAVMSFGVKYETFMIGSDEDMQVLFHCRQSFPEVRIHNFWVATSACSILNIVREGEPDQVENVMREDDSDEKPTDIGEDSDEDILTNPVTHQGLSSSGTQQHPPHFSTLNFDAIGKLPDIVPIFGDQGLHEENAAVEFQIGQSFQSKEEAILSVKDYSIHGGVEYRVIESDHLKYHGRCKEFDKGCTWMICITLR